MCSMSISRRRYCNELDALPDRTRTFPLVVPVVMWVVDFVVRQAFVGTLRNELAIGI